MRAGMLANTRHTQYLNQPPYNQTNVQSNVGSVKLGFFFQRILEEINPVIVFNTGVYNTFQQNRLYVSLSFQYIKGTI